MALEVKRRIGLLGAISFIIGTVIGSGIFISPTASLMYTGSVGLCLVIWTVSGCLNMLLALIYGDLGIMFPKTGGDYAFILNGIGAIPAFLVTWLQTFVSSPAFRALLALVFADNLCAPIFDACGPPNIVRQLIATAEILVLTGTNIYSVSAVASKQIVFAVAKITALAIIIVGGIVFLSQGREVALKSGFDGTTRDPASIVLAIYSCVFAFGGITVTNDIAEEIINPRKNIPRAILVSTVFVTVTYVLVNVSYLTILTKHEFLTAPAVVYVWGSKVLGRAAVIMPIGVMASVYGTGNGGIFVDSRIRFAAAREGHLPEILCFLHHKTLIPLMPIFTTSGIALILLLSVDVVQLINMISFVGVIQQTLALIAYIRLRYKLNNGKSPLRIPMIIPVFTLLVFIFLSVGPFLSATPKIEFLYGAAFITAGLIIYFPFVFFKLVIPGTDRVTTFFQLFLQICPTVLNPDIHVHEHPGSTTKQRSRSNSRERLLPAVNNKLKTYSG